MAASAFRAGLRSRSALCPLRVPGRHSRQGRVLHGAGPDGGRRARRGSVAGLGRVADRSDSAKRRLRHRGLRLSRDQFRTGCFQVWVKGRVRGYRGAEVSGARPIYRVPPVGSRLERLHAEGGERLVSRRHV
uniref:Uncharacterized protein n=1 Tax=uncultured marine virus TaxID=186617 RepID=A0A0F7L6D7_9VIRU|nr:hypothetical protein [uncultured marine virus]